MDFNFNIAYCWDKSLHKEWIIGRTIIYTDEDLKRLFYFLLNK